MNPEGLFYFLEPAVTHNRVQECCMVNSHREKQLLSLSTATIMVKIGFLVSFDFEFILLYC